MLIDWFTVGAQMLNFLILVWLLKRYLYKPILDAVDAREKRIAAELAGAQSIMAEAQKERDVFLHKNEEFELGRASLMRKATEDAKSERLRLIDEARSAADELRTGRQAALRSEAVRLNQAIRRRTEHEVFAIARKALEDLAGASLEERMGEVFSGRLRSMDKSAKADVARALMAASGPALVRSAFDLPAPQRAQIQSALDETFGAGIRVRFETAPELISGIELSTDEHRLAWSIGDYLASLEASVGELTEANEPAPTRKFPDPAPSRP